jgi:hypothetical protein
MGRAQHPAVSVRLPDFVKPMQAKLVDTIPPGDWIYEASLTVTALWLCAAAAKRESNRETKRKALLEFRVLP